MTNDLGCQAVLSDILFCLTYEPSGIIARVRLQALDVCEAKTSPHLGVGNPHPPSDSASPFCALVPSRSTSRLIFCNIGCTLSRASQGGALHGSPTTCRASSAVPTRSQLWRNQPCPHNEVRIEQASLRPALRLALIEWPKSRLLHSPGPLVNHTQDRSKRLDTILDSASISFDLR